MPFLRRLMACVLAATAALLLFGCDVHVGGTHDKQIDFAIERDPDAEPGAPAPNAARVADDVQWRLLASQVTADVAAIDDAHVRVTLDARSAPDAKAVLRWRGGMQLHRVDRTTRYAPPERFQSLLEHVKTADDEYWVGDAATIREAISSSEPIASRRVLPEYIGDLRVRTRVVVATPLVDLGDTYKVVHSIGLVDRGRTVALLLMPVALETIESAESKHPGADVAVVRATTVLAVEPMKKILADDGITIPFGTDVWSYTFAAQELRLLRTPLLPPLTVTAENDVPTRWGIVAACTLLPLLVSFAWLAFVRRFDRAYPEPAWLVVLTFVLGCVSVVPAIYAERFWMGLSPYLNPGVMTLGGQLFAWPIALLVFTVSVGIIEEGVKFLAAWALARHRREFDEPIDGIVYGCAAALGFAAVENARYFGDTRLSSAVVVARTLMSVPAHMLFGAIWGYALGRKVVRKKTRVWAWFLFAALAHGAFDACLSISATSKVAIGVLVLLALLFAWLLRGALRYGAVPERSIVDEIAGLGKKVFAREEPPASSQRVLVQVGFPLEFSLCLAAMLGLAAAIMLYGGSFEEAVHRATPTFFVVGGALLAAFGVATYGVTATLPLEVAIDQVGITFAGRTTKWADVNGIARLRVWGLLGAHDALVLKTNAGDVRLGAARKDAAQRLVAMIAPQVTLAAVPPA